MDDIDFTIETSNGEALTAEDVLREIARTKQPERCHHCAAVTLQAMGAWLPGDPLTQHEASLLVA